MPIPTPSPRLNRIAAFTLLVVAAILGARLVMQDSISTVMAAAPAGLDVKLTKSLDQIRQAEVEALKAELDSLTDQQATERLQEAVYDGQAHLILPLAEKVKLADIRDGSGVPLLFNPLTNGYSHVVDALLTAGADPNVAAEVAPGLSIYPLHTAVTAGYFRSAKLLLDRGADPALRGPDGKTSLEVLQAQGLAGADASLEDVGSLIDERIKFLDQALDGGPTSLTAEEESYRLEQARLARSKEIAARAATAYEQLQQDESDVEALLKLAVCCYEEDFYADALHYATRAARADAASAEAFVLAGNSYRKLQRYEDAIEQCTQALVFEPSHPEALRCRAASYGKISDFEAAEKDLAAAFATDPDDARTHNYAAIIALAKDDPEEANQRLDAALQLDPQYASAYYNRADLFWKADLPGDAIEQLDLAIACDPLNSVAYNRRGYYRRQIGDAVGAMSDFHLALKAASAPAERAMPEHNLGILHLDADRPLPAIDHLSESIAVRPEYAASYELRAEARSAAGVGGADRDRAMAAALGRIEEFVDLAGVSTVHARLEANSELLRDSEEMKKVLAAQGFKGFDWEASADEPVRLSRFLLCTLATGDHEAALRALLAHGVDVNCTSPDGLTPLHLAAMHSDNELVIWRLIEAGADLDARSPGGQTAVDMLLERARTTEFLKEALGNVPKDAKIEVSHFPTLLRNLIKLSIHDDLKRIASLENEHQQSLKQDADEEAEISQAEILIGAGGAVGPSPLITRLSRLGDYADQREMRRQMRGVTQAKLEAAELLVGLSEKFEAMYTITDPERMLLSGHARQSAAWITAGGAAGSDNGSSLKQPPRGNWPTAEEQRLEAVEERLRSLSSPGQR